MNPLTYVGRGEALAILGDGWMDRGGLKNAHLVNPANERVTRAEKGCSTYPRDPHTPPDPLDQLPCLFIYTFFFKECLSLSCYPALAKQRINSHIYLLGLLFRGTTFFSHLVHKPQSMGMKDIFPHIFAQLKPPLLLLMSSSGSKQPNACPMQWRGHSCAHKLFCK